MRAATHTNDTGGIETGHAQGEKGDKNVKQPKSTNPIKQRRAAQKGARENGPTEALKAGEMQGSAQQTPVS